MMQKFKNKQCNSMVVAQKHEKQRKKKNQQPQKKIVFFSKHSCLNKMLIYKVTWVSGYKHDTLQIFITCSSYRAHFLQMEANGHLMYCGKTLSSKEYSFLTNMESLQTEVVACSLTILVLASLP
jgi:hypothetical protein